MESQDMLRYLIDLGISSGLVQFTCDQMKVGMELNRFEFDEIRVKNFLASFNGANYFCKVSVIQGPTSKAQRYIQSALLAYDSVKEFPLFCEVYGFFINYENFDEIEYGLITKSYPKFINFALRPSKERPLRKISKLFKGIFYLHSIGFFYGLINPEMIFITKSQIPKIELNFFITKLDEFDFKNYLNILKVLDIDHHYLAPEVLFALEKHEYSFQEVDAKAIDYFAVGCISLMILKTNPHPFILECKSFHFSKHLINQNDDALYNSIQNIKERESILIEIKKFEDCIKTSIQKCEKKRLCKLIKYSTKIIISKRISCILSLGKELLFTSDVTSPDLIREVIQYFYIVIKEIRSIEFKVETITDACENEKIESICESCILETWVYTVGREQFYFLPKEWVKLDEVLARVKLALERFSPELEAAYISFYSTLCSSEHIKLIDGSMIFLRNSFNLLAENRIGILKLSETLKSEDLISSIDFYNFFVQLSNHSLVHQNFIVFSMIMSKIEEDFLYFFNLSIYKKLSLFKFSDSTLLLNEFRTIIEKDCILECLSRFNACHTKTREVVDQLLSKVYLTKTMYTCCGLSTYNKFIFISNGSLSLLESLHNKQRRAVFYIILLHELAHLLRRVNCNTFQEARNTLTPTSIGLDDKKTCDEDFRTEREREGQKGEAGFSLETMIFGERVVTLSKEAGNFLLTFKKNMSLNKFTEIFQEYQKMGSNHIRVERSGSSLGDLLPVRCNFRNSLYG